MKAIGAGDEYRPNKIIPCDTYNGEKKGGRKRGKKKGKKKGMKGQIKEEENGKKGKEKGGKEEERGVIKDRTEATSKIAGLTCKRALDHPVAGNTLKATSTETHTSSFRNTGIVRVCHSKYGIVWKYHT